MRIIAGKYRRRKLLTSPGMTTRPITDRVKETLFERLGDVPEGARVADIFAGTGSLGLEALSRGAAGVVFIEQDARAFELLKKNVQTLGAEPEVLCWRTDAVRSSFRPKNRDELLPYTLIFFDPPYRMVPALREGSPLFRSLQRLARPGVSEEGALLVFRVPSGAEFTCPSQWKPQRVLELSTMEVHLFTLERSAESDGGGEEAAGRTAAAGDQHDEHL